MIKIVNEVDFSNFDEKDVGPCWEDDLDDKNAVLAFVRAELEGELDGAEPEEGVDYEWDEDDGVVTLKSPEEHYLLLMEINAFEDIYETAANYDDLFIDNFKSSKNEQIRQIACDETQDEEDRMSEIYNIIDDMIYSINSEADENAILNMVHEDWGIWGEYFRGEEYYLFYTAPDGTRWFCREL